MVGRVFPRIQALRGYALFAFLLLLAACAASERDSGPQAVKGRLHLSDWDFSARGPVRLDGEWEFAWNAAYDPAAPRWKNPQAEPQSPPDFLLLPGLWQGATARGVRLSPHGRAVYRLRIDVLPDSTPKALFISSPLSVCRAWVNGRIIGTTGSYELEKPKEHMMTPRFSSAAPVLDIVLEVANQRNMTGGLNTGILLGTDAQIRRLVAVRWVVGAFVGGGLLVLCAYHLALFLLRRTEKANLFIGLFCLMWTIAMVFSPEGGFLAEHFISLPWSWGVTLSLLPYGLTIPLMVVFYHELFPKKHARLVNSVYTVLGAAYAAYILATPPNAFDSVSLWYFFITRSAFLYLFAAFAVDLAGKKKGIRFLAPGYLALGLAEFDDILFDLHVAGFGGMAPVGVFLFIISFSCFLSVRFSRMQAHAVQLAARLDLLNRQPSPRPPHQGPDKRLLAVQVMRLAVECWERTSGTEKADLAEQSGLWNVYVEKDGYRRTQTLDKYLRIETLPKRPRWKQIRATAVFVLTHRQGQPGCEDLAQALRNLQDTA